MTDLESIRQLALSIIALIDGGKDGSGQSSAGAGVPSIPANPGLLVNTPRQEAIVPSSPLQPRDYFTCPSCGQRKEWVLTRPRWPNAMCVDCFRRSRSAGTDVAYGRPP